MGVVSFLVLKPCRASSGMTRGTTAVETSDDASSRCWRPTDLVRAAYHPDFHRRSRSFTRSTGRWLRPGRGLSPPVRSCTDPGARLAEVCHAGGPHERLVTVDRAIFSTPPSLTRPKVVRSRITAPALVV